MRTQGFYWIRFKQGRYLTTHWIVGFWKIFDDNHSYWRVPGSVKAWTDSDLKEIKENVIDEPK